MSAPAPFTKVKWSRREIWGDVTWRTPAAPGWSILRCEGERRYWIRDQYQHAHGFDDTIASAKDRLLAEFAEVAS